MNLETIIIVKRADTAKEDEDYFHAISLNIEAIKFDYLH